MPVKSKATYEAAANALCEAMPPLLHARFDTSKQGVCILATRLAVDALQNAGLRAAPLTTELVAMSPALAKHMSDGGEFTQDAPGWSVGIMERQEREPGGYNGHLVAVLNDKWILDLTLGQVRRPKHDLLVRPTFAEAEGFTEGKPTAVEFANGSVVFYRPQPWREDFFVAPDWTDTLRKYPELVKAAREAVLQNGT